MPINLPNLDDRRFADLMEEALRLIPAHAPEWTNHNPSDPGITLVELFAYVTEMLIYRLNRVTPEHTLAFLKLIEGDNWKPLSDWKPLKECTTADWEKKERKNKEAIINEWWQQCSAEERNRVVAETVMRLRTPERAVSTSDFEDLVYKADERVARAHCIPGAMGQIRIIVVPKTINSDPSLSPDLKKKIEDALSGRCPLTTQIKVEGPKLVEISITLKLELENDAVEADVKIKAEKALRQFLDPRNWPFGQAVYKYKIMELFADLPGIRKVQITNLSGTTTSGTTPPTVVVRRNDIKLDIKPDELVIFKTLTFE